MVTQKVKASDRQAVCRKLVTSLKKTYKAQPPKYDYSVLETILFGICLENTDYEQAGQAYHRLTDRFYDLNEVRVSSITEIQNAFQDLSHPEWRAQRVRETLQFVFEAYYSFDLEILQKKTLEQAEKILNKIKSLSPFVKNYVLMSVLGAHVVPVDASTHRFSAWLGLASADSKESEVSDLLKSAVRKAETPQFCYLLRMIATSPKYQDYFDDIENAEENGEPLLFSAPSRLNDLLAGKLKKKPAPKKTPAVKATKAKKKAAKSSAKAKKAKAKTEKAAPKKKAAAKKTTKKPAAKKSAKKKTAPAKKTSKKKKASSRKSKK